MGGFLKNVLVTAVLVIAGTAGTTAVAGLVVLIGTSSASNDYTVLMHGGAGVIMVAAAVGVGFSVVSLFIAALTMPPALGITRAFKLPRPVADMIGGGAAGWLCASIALGFMKELTRSKGGEPPDAIMIYALCSIGVLGGMLIGYWRHSVLVRSPVQLLARPAAA